MLKSKFNFSFKPELIKKIYTWAKSKNLSFILYRPPVKKVNKKNYVRLILSQQDLKNKKITDLENKKLNNSIFIFTKFFKNEKNSLNYSSISFFEYEIYLNFDEKKIFYQDKLEIVNLVKKLKQEITSLSPPSYINFYTKKNSLKIKSTPKIKFTDQVKRILNKINHNPSLKKLVLSKIKVIKSNDNPLDFFCRINSIYNNAMVYLVSSPEVGTWLGASPELLIKKDAEGIFETLALAGTYLVKSKTKEEKDNLLTNKAIWSSKEVEEQAYVSRDIINAFKQIRLREFEEVGPTNLRIGNLIHLSTIFRVNSKLHYGSKLPFAMLKRLHPTSAVCGYPRDKALAVIQEIEEHDRDYYTGYLGPIEINPSGPAELLVNLYVNLRCCQIFSKEEKLKKNRDWVFYTGVGLTKDSLSLNEWFESEGKVKVLKKYLKKN